MALWRNQPNTYRHSGFIDIPEGEHRVRICRVEVERFSGNRKCFEITLEVSGYHGKLWYHLWYDPEKITECEKRFYPFFYSFDLEDHDLSHYKKWVGLSGAVSVSYDYHDYGCEAKYIYCIYGTKKDRLPPWKDAPYDVELFKEMPF
jgi:hypothetical protein